MNKYWNEDEYYFVFGEFLYYSSPSGIKKLNKVSAKEYKEKAITKENCGEIVVQGDWVYYRNISQNNSLYKISTSGTGKMLLDERYSEPLKFYYDELYYSNLPEFRNTYYSRNLCRVDESGDKKIVVDNREFDFIDIFDSYIYYTDNIDNDSLYRTKTDGSVTEKLTERAVSFRQVVFFGDKIYFTMAEGTEKKSFGLYRMGLDGRNCTKISKDNFVSSELYKFILYDDKIYYINPDNFAIYSIDLDGTNRRKLIDDKCFYMKIASGYIYYTNKNDGDKLYRYNLNAKEKTRINDFKSRVISISGDYLYYCNYSVPTYPNNYTPLRINLETMVQDTLFSDYDIIFSLNEK